MEGGEREEKKKKRNPPPKSMVAAGLETERDEREGGSAVIFGDALAFTGIVTVRGRSPFAAASF